MSNDYLKKSVKKLLILILVTLGILIVSFIFGNSVQTVSESTAQSKKVLGFMFQLFKNSSVSAIFTEHIVRKIAHFIEFSAFGVDIAFIFGLSKKNYSAKSLPLIILLVLLCALFDETIQIFTGRGSLVSDVWLDFFGGMFGFSGTTMIILLIKSVNKKKKLK